MKKILMMLLLVGLAGIIAACMPNRLSRSLVTPETQPGDPALAAPEPGGRNLQPQLGNANINLDEVVTLLPPDAIPAVFPDEVPQIMIPAAEADAAGMRPDTRVLGVSVDGDSRAYPIPFMSEHEIVNDTVGGRPVAATW